MAKIIPLKEHKDYRIAGRYVTIREYYDYIPQSNGKPVSIHDQKLFDLLMEFTENSKNLPLDYTWLAGRLKKTKGTINRGLKRLSNLFHFSLERFALNKGIAEFNKIHIKRTDLFDQIISSAISNMNYAINAPQSQSSSAAISKQLSRDNAAVTPQAPGGNAASLYISNKNKKEINKNVYCLKTCARAEQVLDLKEKLMETNTSDEIFFFGEKQEYSSTGEKQEEHISDVLEITKEQEYASKEYLDDSEEEQAQINALETGIKEIEPERSMPKYALNRDCELELNYELSKAFDLKTYSQITAQITFSYDKNNHKLTLIHSSPLNFSLAQKESLKSVFTKVYGEAVALSSRARVKNENLGTKSQDSIINDSGIELWEKVKDAVKAAKGEAYVRSWLQPLAPKLDEENKKLSVSGPMFFLSFIQRDLEPVLEQVMKRAGYTCDLIGYERGEEKLVASVPFVKFFPIEGQSASDFSVKLKTW